MGTEGLPLLAAGMLLGGFFGMLFFSASMWKALSFGLFQAALILYAFSLSEASKGTNVPDPLPAVLGSLTAGVGLGLFLVLFALGRRAGREER